MAGEKKSEQKSTNGLSTDMDWVKRILERIEERLNDEESDCRDRHTIIDKELTAIKIRAGIYGAIAGTLPAVAGVVVILLNG